MKTHLIHSLLMALEVCLYGNYKTKSNLPVYVRKQYIVISRNFLNYGQSRLDYRDDNWAIEKVRLWKIWMGNKTCKN